MWVDVSPPPCTKTSVSRPHHYPSASFSIGWRDRAHAEKKSQQNIFNLYPAPDKEKKIGMKKQRREELQCGWSYDGGFYLLQTKYCRGTIVKLWYRKVTAWYFDSYHGTKLLLNCIVGHYQHQKIFCLSGWLTGVLWVFFQNLMTALSTNIKHFLVFLCFSWVLSTYCIK